MTSNTFFHAALLTSVFAAPLVCSAVARADVYELRIYTARPGTLDKLNARFRDHTVRLFKKHGIESLGYWVPTDEAKSKNTLIYVIKHKSRDAAAASWKAFIADPEWKKAARESGVGRLAKRPESIYMTATDYSPKALSGIEAGGVYELRTYRCAEGRLKNLDARFRDHTMKLFEKHGMKNIAYWHPTDGDAAKDTLIYIIKHQSKDAAGKSWKAFGSDPAWRKVAAESQKDGRILRERPESVYMKSTDYSALK